MKSFIYLQATFIPNDFELPIPGNVPFFKFLIVFSFLLHIIFVNMTLSGAVFAVYHEIKGIITKQKVYDRLAFQLATQTSIFKSIAVVLGVAPLLLISVIYTQFFYPSTILIGKAWLSIILLLTIAFLLLYAYKFTWVRLKRNKGIHLMFGLSGTLILLFIPLIFIVNIVSMLYPEMWSGANGFFHSLFYYPQIWQRYAHFILTSFAVMGIFMYLWNRRQLSKLHASLNENDSSAQSETAATTEKENKEAPIYNAGKRFGISMTFWTTILQFIFGSLVLVSLETDKMLLYMGGDSFLTGLLIASIAVTMLLTFFLYLVMRTDAKRWVNLAATSFLIVVALMGWMLHEVRELYVEPHREANPPTVMQEEAPTLNALNKEEK
ncbi:cytochrome c class I [Bacillus tianshenii]|nr:cytochrome c class I [Bacillus tianshenii]